MAGTAEGGKGSKGQEEGRVRMSRMEGTGEKYEKEGRRIEGTLTKCTSNAKVLPTVEQLL